MLYRSLAILLLAMLAVSCREDIDRPSPVASGGPFSGFPGGGNPRGEPSQDGDGQGQPDGGSPCAGVVCTDPDAPICCPNATGGSFGVTACTRIFDDPRNCGGCGLECGPGARCENGSCTSGTCDERQVACLDPEEPLCCDQPWGQGDPGCAAIFEDPFNCGGCGIRCEAREQCVAGFCTESTATAPSIPQ